MFLAGWESLGALGLSNLEIGGLGAQGFWALRLQGFRRRLELRAPGFKIPFPILWGGWMRSS